jgi:hypothetical protein
MPLPYGKGIDIWGRRGTKVSAAFLLGVLLERGGAFVREK